MEKKIIYQVLPRLFGNTTKKNVPNGSLEENGTGKFSSFTPEVLNSIRSMGINMIWYTGVIEHATQEDFSAYGITLDPIATVKGRAGSPYAIKDYYDVNPYLADEVDKRMEEFEALVKRTHKAKLSVMIDFVPNHVARCYHSDAKPKGVKDFGEDDRTDYHFYNKNNFYYFPNEELGGFFADKQYREYPARATGNDCFHAYPSENDWYETVKLNYGIDYCGGKRHEFEPIPDTWDKMVNILLFWASKGVDAFRCDMAEMVPVEFWAYAIPKVKNKYKKVIFVAEIYQPNLYHRYIFEGGFDYLYDKVGLYDRLRSITCGFEHAASITRCWQQNEGINHYMLNFLENHDEQRIASDFFARNPFKACPSIVVSALINTCPFMLYAGQELGEPGMDVEGFSGSDGRTSIFDFWTVDSLHRWYNNGACNDQWLSAEEVELRNFYSKVLTLANKEKALREGIFHDLSYVNYSHEGYSSQWNFSFIRKFENDFILVVINFFPYTRKVKINIPDFILKEMKVELRDKVNFKELLTDKKQTQPLNGTQPLEFEMTGHSALILKAKASTAK